MRYFTTLIKPTVAFLLLPLLLLQSSCRSNPHKADVVETPVEKSDMVASDAKIGLNKEGEMVYQKKAILAEELRKLENDVYDLEDRVYGTRKYGTQGLYGKYSTCLRKVETGDRGNLPKLEKIDRWSDKDENASLGLNQDSTKLTSITEEKLRDRLGKFQEYRRVLQEREDQYNESIKNCEAVASRGKAGATNK